MRKPVLIALVLGFLVGAIVVRFRAGRSSVPAASQQSGSTGSQPNGGSTSADAGVEGPEGLESPEASTQPSDSKHQETRSAEPVAEKKDTARDPERGAADGMYVAGGRWPSEDAFFTEKYSSFQAPDRLQAAYRLSDVLDAHHAGNENPASALTEEEAVVLAHEIEWLKLHPNP